MQGKNLTPEQKSARAKRRQRSVPLLWLGPAALAAALLLAFLFGQTSVKGSLATRASATRNPGQATPATVTAPTLPPAAEAQPTPVTAALPGNTPTQAAPTTLGLMTTADEVHRIEPAAAKVLLDKDEAVLYDTRPAESFQTRHAAGAISLPEDQIQSHLSTLPKDKILILYCT